MSSPAITSDLISTVLVLTILSIGLTVSVADLRVTARRYGLLLRALLANVVHDRCRGGGGRDRGGDRGGDRW